MWGSCARIWTGGRDILFMLLSAKLYLAFSWVCIALFMDFGRWLGKERRMDNCKNNIFCLPFQYCAIAALCAGCIGKVLGLNRGSWYARVWELGA